jgi:uncharacterized protein (UPF0371 family)
MKRGFDAEKYIASQSFEILKRVRKFSRLYLEFGGKLCYDEHASRVLPGYKTTTKIEILKRLGDLRIIYCIYAKDLENNRMVGMSGMNYKKKILKDLKDIDGFGFKKINIVITRFNKEKRAKKFADRLKRDYKIYFHTKIEGYGVDIKKTLAGYEKQKYIPIKENFTIVTGPAGGSGKMGFCLSQIYHERKKKINSGFAKFETFPIWNLPLNHPVNLAYEAATADLGDVNMIDPYHLKTYNKKAVNYNRDIENFGILLAIARKVTCEKWPCGYKSPTDMGVNMGKFGIINDKVVRHAAIGEIKRRRGAYKKEFKKTSQCERVISRMDNILKKII